MRKFIGKFLAAGLCVAMALSSVTVKADIVDQKYLALGADLTASQKKKVLELLNLDDNSDYKVITVTNKDEHEYLDSYLSSRVIGTRALSSATFCFTSAINFSASSEPIFSATSPVVISSSVAASLLFSEIFFPVISS